MASVTYKIPERSRSEKDPKTLTFTQINQRQELDAAKAAEAKGLTGQNAYVMAFTYECIRRSVTKVDGVDVDWTGTAPEWIERTSPKVLNFAVRAYNKLHQVDESEMADFLASADTAV